MATTEEIINHIIELKLEQGKLVTEVTYLRTELHEHRHESKETRKEIDELKGGLKLFKWLSGSALAGLFLTLLKYLINWHV